VANKLFDGAYLISTQGRFVLINGEQIVKIEAQQADGGWAIVMHLSDGSKYTLEETQGDDFYNNFMKDIIKL
jgi:hypothetical protein